MKRLVEFPLEEGGSLLVQIDEPESSGAVRAGREEVIEKAQETFEKALDGVLPAATSVIERLRSLEPDEIEVTFGFNLSARASAFIAAVASAANFSVSIHWKKNKETTPSG